MEEGKLYLMTVIEFYFLVTTDAISTNMLLERVIIIGQSNKNINIPMIVNKLKST